MSNFAKCFLYINFYDYWLFFFRLLVLWIIQGLAKVGSQLFVWKNNIIINCVSCTHNCKPNFAHPCIDLFLDVQQVLMYFAILYNTGIDLLMLLTLEEHKVGAPNPLRGRKSVYNFWVYSGPFESADSANSRQQTVFSITHWGSWGGNVKLTVFHWVGLLEYLDQGSSHLCCSRASCICLKILEAMLMKNLGR